MRPQPIRREPQLGKPTISESFELQQEADITLGTLWVQEDAQSGEAGGLGVGGGGDHDRLFIEGGIKIEGVFD